MILFARNIKYIRIFAGVPSKTGRQILKMQTTWLADVFILGTCRCVQQATHLLVTFKIYIRLFDQCAECDLLKFVQNQIRAK